MSVTRAGDDKGVRLDDVLLKEIVRRILSVSRPDRVIVFGSAATGRMNADSDIDLLILEARPQKARDQSLTIRTALDGLGFPFDVIVMATDRFEETKGVIGGLAYPAQKYGKVIFEAA